MKCAFLANVTNAEIRKAKSGRDYLSLTVEEAGDSSGEAVWVALWDRGRIDRLCAAVKPGSQVYVEGSVRLRRWDDECGNHRSALAVSATHIEVFPIPQEAKGGARRQMPARRTKTAHAALVHSPALTPASDSKAILDAAQEQLGGMLRKGRSDVDAPMPIAMPEKTRSWRKYERPFDDPLPF